ncbi:MAG: copper resistance CopC family protein [Gemmatimonadaceae bacterium]
MNSLRSIMAALVVTFVAPAAPPHAALTRAEPAVGGHTATAPKVLRLWFSEAPEVLFTRLALSDSSGVAVTLGKVQKGDTKLEIRSKIAGPMHAGRYAVTWRTAAADGHATSGTFAFTVDASR